jgi:NitT/TauT family transport system substrate-binding protein
MGADGGRISMKKQGIVLALAACMTLALCSCSKKTKTPETQTGNLKKVSLGTVAWPTNMFFYLAKEKGIFAKNGLDVDIREFSSTTDSSNAFIGGQTDFCTYASSETISPFAQGGDISIVLETDKSNGCEGLVAKSEIKSVEDLKGKTIATQLYSVDHMFLLTLLQDHHMASSDVKIVDMSIGDAGNAFCTGKCDAACIWDPYFSQAKKAGGTVLYSTANNPNLITDVLAASKALCKNKPEIVKAMVKSYFDAAEYWKSNTDDSVSFMAGKLGVDSAEFTSEMNGLIVPSVAEAVKAFTPDESYTYWGYTQNTVKDFLKKLNVIKVDRNCNDMIDAGFVNSLKQ